MTGELRTLDEQLADRDIGWIRLRFHVSSAIADLPDAATVQVATHTGSMLVSSPELTAADLVASPALAGGLNNLCKRIKRVAFGMTNFRNWRIRCLLYAGKPDWDLLAGITPCCHVMTPPESVAPAILHRWTSTVRLRGVPNGH